MPQPLVWQRRQMPPQQATTGSALMKEVERINAVIVREQGQGLGQDAGVPLRWDPYVMEVDRGRNCYVCESFGHMAYHCRNKRKGKVIEGRRVEYRGGKIKEIYEHSNNLKGVESLELLD